MIKAKKHGFIAFFMDIMIIGSIFQILGSLAISLTLNNFQMTIYAITIGTYFTTTFFYHIYWFKKAHFCSPGEKITGCMYDEDIGKEWYNIFSISRWFLFLNIFLLLLLPANAFDSFQQTNNYPIAQVIGKSIYTAICLWSIYQIGVGKFKWSIVIFILLIIKLITSYSFFKVETELAYLAIGFYSIQTVFLIVTLSLYPKRIIKDNS